MCSGMQRFLSSAIVTTIMNIMTAGQRVPHGTRLFVRGSVKVHQRGDSNRFAECLQVWRGEQDLDAIACFFFFHSFNISLTSYPTL